MIISHARRFIFIKPMKVAGTSIEIALSRHCKPGDVITPFGKKDEATRRQFGFTGAQNYCKPWTGMRPKDWLALAYFRERPKLYLNHAPASQVRKTLPAAIWRDYLKIAVVRNPYDVAVSRYFWDQRLQSLPPFQTWLFERPEILMKNRRITHIDGQSPIDFMIRYEHMAEDLTKLSDRLGLDSSLAEDIGQINTKTDKRPRDKTAAALFDGFEDGMRLVELLCAEDIALYGYERPAQG